MSRPEATRGGSQPGLPSEVERVIQAPAWSHAAAHDLREHGLHPSRSVGAVLAQPVPVGIRKDPLQVTDRAFVHVVPAQMPQGPTDPSAHLPGRGQVPRGCMTELNGLVSDLEPAAFTVR